MRVPWLRKRPPLDVCVQRALERGGVDTTSVAVVAVGHRVVLRGTVPDDVSREQAVELTKAVRGVRELDDRLSVVAPVAEAVQAPARRDSTAETYVVQAGDTLPRVAERVLGDRSRWREIRALNRKVVEGTGPLPPGLRLTLPDV